MLFNLFLLVSLKNTPLIADFGLVQWKAPAIFFSFALLLFIVQFVSKKSLVQFVFGERLGLSDAFWSKWTFVLILYCIFVASADIVVAQLVSFDTWNKFKLFMPLAVFTTLVVLFPRYYRHSQP